MIPTPRPIIVQAGEPRGLTPENVAEMLSCSLQHAYRLIERRKLAAVNLAPNPKKRKLYRVPLAALAAFLQDAVVS